MGHPSKIFFLLLVLGIYFSGEIVEKWFFLLWITERIRWASEVSGTISIYGRQS